MKSYKDTAIDYAERVVSGEVIIGQDAVNACKRFLNDLCRDDIEIRTHDADFAINFIQKTIRHKKGEDLTGKSLVNRLLILEPWQIFIVYNLLGFYHVGTDIRRFTEALIVTGRKNGKTSFTARLAWAVSVLQAKSGSVCYIVSNSTRQSKESFDFLWYSLKRFGFKKYDNTAGHRINGDIGKGQTIEINAMPNNPTLMDGFNCNFVIADEIGAYKNSNTYDRFKEATQNYTNKLIVGITTAGDNINSFGHDHMEYAKKVAGGTVTDDKFFSFVCCADEGEKGYVDYTNPVQHQKANPNYGVTIRPDDILNMSLQAQNDPRKRKSFLSRSLNIYTSNMRAYFDLKEFQDSDRQYNWSLQELSKLPITWYGGADLSRMYDLTARALYGNYQGVDIVITHAFFPVTEAHRKADEDNIPLFGWQDDGWLTMCNTPTVNYDDVVNWFVMMRGLGFRIKQVGHDRKFGREYIAKMQKARFNIIDQPQLYLKKSEGFRHIEKAVKDGKLYYLHSQAYEYCVENVSAVEKVDDAVQYAKVGENSRIDLFDASVFACMRYLEGMEDGQVLARWFGVKKEDK